jgi:diketogulonate reductase-like aldo/keto reductase
MTTSPLLTLNNGIKMPALGFGTLDRTEPERIAGAVEAAIATGYRLIDTAASYAVERQVGEGIRRNGIARSELFVTTKLWISDYGYDRALRACETSLRKLGLEYLDLYLLHWPVPADFEATVASFQAAERLLAEGRVRAIGVSNFNPKHLQNLIERTRVLPVVNQVELHPFLIQREMRDANARHSIVTQSWSPIGGVYLKNPTAVQGPLDHPCVVGGQLEVEDVEVLRDPNRSEGLWNRRKPMLKVPTEHDLRRSLAVCGRLFKRHSRDRRARYRNACRH